MVRIFVLIGLLGMILPGQTQVDIEKQAKRTEFLRPPFPQPVRTGSELPPTCEVGELFFHSSAPPGGNLYVCHAANEWAPQGSAGQGTVTIENDGTMVGVRPTVNFVPGVGIVQVLTDFGDRVAVSHAVDTAVVMTKRDYQSGASALCAASTADGLAYECLMVPTLEAYRPGMVLHWKPELENVGGTVTLNVDNLGAKPISLADGSAQPEAGDFQTHGYYELWYDGIGFRVVSSVISRDYLTAADVQSGRPLYCESQGTVANAFTCSLSPALTTLSEGILIHWRPDVDISGGATTLDIGNLGAIPVRRSDGIGDPEPGDLRMGELYLLWFDGEQFRLLGKGSETFLPIDEYQSGNAVVCESSLTAEADYTCETAPPLAGYVRGMVLHWIPAAAATAAPMTLDVNGLGAMDLRLADGVSNPAPGDIHPGAMYPLWFDGMQFRILGNRPGAVPQTARPPCSDTLRGRLWFTKGEAGVADGLWVCAKDTNDQAGWQSLN